jgi:hypothetical protein
MNALTPERLREIIAQLGDAKPATDEVLMSLAEAVSDRRGHQHPAHEDIFCANLTGWMGERMAPVLRRLLNAEAEVTRLRAVATTVYRASHDAIVMGLYVTREAAHAHCLAELREQVAEAAYDPEADA